MPLIGRTRSILLASTLLGGPVAAAGAANFEAGNQAHDSLYDFGAHIASFSDPDTAPTAGGTLTINGQALGSYDYAIKDGNETISSFSNGDWFTTTEDSRSAIIVVKGNLTINSGQVLIPSNRKLFTLLYVTGDLVCEGGISMTARGANHSASGSNITAAAIRIIDGVHGGVTDPEVPAAGAGGGTGVTSLPGNPGSAGAAGQTGGGGSGAAGTLNPVSGAGATGSSFSGGPGGGGASSNGGLITGGAGVAAGGAGGDAVVGGNGNRGPCGGAGNPGGVGQSLGTGVGLSGSDGTGGVLIVIALGAVSGSGAISANGANGGGAGSPADRGGGASGGGSITVLYGSDTSSITPAANGGTGGDGSVADGGNGGAGTARKLQLAA